MTKVLRGSIVVVVILGPSLDLDLRGLIPGLKPFCKDYYTKRQNMANGRVLLIFIRFYHLVVRTYYGRPYFHRRAIFFIHFIYSPSKIYIYYNFNELLKKLVVKAIDLLAVKY